MLTVYLISNMVNGKLYVGKTKRTLKLRWRWHVYDSKKLNHIQPLAHAIRKYGASSFVIGTIGTANTAEEWSALECHFIALFRSQDRKRGYNVTAGGEGCAGWIPSKRFRQRLSETRKGSLHPMFGKKHSQETRDMMRESHTGKPHPQIAHGHDPVTGRFL